MITVIIQIAMSSRKKLTLLQKCNEVFLKLDMFSNPELFKYKGEGTYQTYTGSILSVLIVALFVAAFFNYVKQTLNREKITTTPKLRPSLDSTFNTNQSSSIFMFAVGLEGVDLNAPDRLFDIFLESRIYKNSKLFSLEKVGLQPCLAEQWEGINAQFKKTFARLNFQQWLCPPKDYNFTFKGKYTSQDFRYSRLVVKRCQSDSGCANDSAFMNALLKQQTFKLSVYFSNPVIDASEKQYLEYVLEDTNYFEFTDMVGVSSHIFFTEYEVNTDNSVYPEPFSDTVTERGLTLIERPVVSNFEIINTDEFLRINLRKSDLIQQFDRTYTRLDVTFAYLGGLFGMTLLFFYGMKAFSEYAYEFEIGSRLFVYSDDKRSEFESTKFNIFRFPLYLCYCTTIFFYPDAEEWGWFGFYRKVDECRDEVKEQTDVCFLIKRVIYIEKAIELFFNSKLDQLKIDHRWTIEEARQKREFYDNHAKVFDIIRTSDKKASQMHMQEQSLNKPPLIDALNDLIPLSKRKEQERASEVHSPPKFSPSKQDEREFRGELKDEEIKVAPQVQVEINQQLFPEVESQQQLFHPHLDKNESVPQQNWLGSERMNRVKEKKKGLIEFSQKERVQKGSSEGLTENMDNKENVQVSFFNVANFAQGRSSSKKSSNDL